MEKYSRIMNLDGAVIVLNFVAAALLFSSSCVAGVSYAVPSSSPSPTTNLPSVKITSPHKDQHVPVGSNIVVLGTSSPPPTIDKTHTDCTVSVLLNVKPYQNALATGHSGAVDYSTWIYRPNSLHSDIKVGPNKITAKITCAASPTTNLTKFYSVNVTGIAGPIIQQGANGENGANGLTFGGNGGSSIGGNGGNGGNGGSATANGGNAGIAIGGRAGNGGNGGSANGGIATGGKGGNGGNGGSANGGNGGNGG